MVFPWQEEENLFEYILIGLLAVQMYDLYSVAGDPHVFFQHPFLVVKW